MESGNPVSARFWVIVKENMNRASDSTEGCSRELLKVFLQDLFHPGRRVPPPEALTHRHISGSTESESDHSLQNFGMWLFRERWVLLPNFISSGVAPGPSDTLTVSPRMKGNGLVLSELNPTAWARPPSWMVYLPSGTKSRFLAVGFWQKVNNVPAPSSWWG